MTIIRLIYVLIIHFPPQSKYKEASKKDMQSGLFTKLPETRDTAHSKQMNKLVSGVRCFSFNNIPKNCGKTPPSFNCRFHAASFDSPLSLYRNCTKQSLRRRRVSRCIT